MCETNSRSIYTLLLSSAGVNFVRGLKRLPTSYSWSVNSSCVDRIEIDFAHNHTFNKICGQIICLVEVARVLISD
jgi:hypothetical protein